jgi:hypothetical protein
MIRVFFHVMVRLFTQETADLAALFTRFDNLLWNIESMPEIKILAGLDFEQDCWFSDGDEFRKIPRSIAGA